MCPTNRFGGTVTYKYAIFVFAPPPPTFSAAPQTCWCCLSSPFRKMALVPFSYASPFTDQLQLAERLFTIGGRLLKIQQVGREHGSSVRLGSVNDQKPPRLLCRAVAKAKPSSLDALAYPHRLPPIHNRPGKGTARAGQILGSARASTLLHMCWRSSLSATHTLCEGSGW